MSERYRTDYDGEFVIISNTIKDGKKHQEREWIDNPIENQHISGRAAVIGHGNSRYEHKLARHFDLKNNLERHKGGHLARKRLQTYGSEGCWQELQCDFYVEFNVEKLQELLAAEYQKRCSVYSNARNVINNPGELFLVPYGTRGTTIGVAAWLACFDGHKEVFLIGCDATKEDGSHCETRLHSLNAVFNEYRGVQFIWVSDFGYPPDVWRENRNVTQWRYSEFISNCDI